MQGNITSSSLTSRAGREGGQPYDLYFWLLTLQGPRWLTGLCVIASCRSSAITPLEAAGDHTSVKVPAPTVARTNPSSIQDMLSRHMYRLYEKYNREKRLKEGNTVRSFRRLDVIQGDMIVYRLNLTTLQESEVILSATFHFLLDKHTLTRPWFCKRFKSPTCHSAFTQPSPPISLMFRSLSFGSEVRSEPVESSLGNVTFYPHRKGVWQMKDVTKLIKEAQARGQFLLSLELDFGQQPHKKQGDVFSAVSMPYLLLYANDQALAEPNSVAASLQRYDPISEGAEVLHRSNSSPRLKGRIRRQTDPLPDTIQNNELPDVNFRPKRDKAEPQTLKGEERIGRVPSQSSVLSFDEQTMRKARRRQWGQNRRCSRRNLRVDFADIGWNEWVIAPESFDAYYCAGACGFPMPQAARPSNHATIQSIVRAVGIIPGIPEPCCVPENMSPLAVLFQEESRNLVLKVYPNMSVQSCSCR
uniref:Growth/differentiation factor 10 n=1 Tax=Poecilia reticulata TaxID=8081 RepID=A0A3P9QBD7_POERE